MCSFCHVALVDIPLCFLIQNLAEIGQSVDELWPKKRFSRWRPPPSWILKISIFVRVTVIGFNIWCSVPNFIKIIRLFTEIWRFNDFQNGGRPPILDFTRLHLLSHSPCQHAVLLRRTKFRRNRTIRRWFMANFSLRYGDLTIFKMAAVRHLGF